MQDPDSDAAPNEDYELNDDFIDDSEVYEFYEGDWRKPKHTGFYINNVSNSSAVVGIALNTRVNMFLTGRSSSHRRSSPVTNYRQLCSAHSESSTTCISLCHYKQVTSHTCCICIPRETASRFDGPGSHANRHTPAQGFCTQS